MSRHTAPHSFFIPVMGTGFTIDSPLFVAKYGISSVISLVDDVLIEQMRKYWCKKTGEPYEEIGSDDKDARAKRITAYLNLLNKIVGQQIIEIKKLPFEPNSEITKYFELLADDHALKQLYNDMLQEQDEVKKQELQGRLREAVVPGEIEVNIMTKLDKPNHHEGEPLPYEFSDAAAAFRGYAKSELSSSMVFSAGFNPNLYGYISRFEDFFPDKNSNIKKRICLKVSDYRSAMIQGKYLAKKGIWVSEYRIESPLNCGGHAFVNDGQLLGPILAEFKERKEELKETLYGFYQKALDGFKKFCSDVIPQVKITAQGGIGTNSEHELLIRHYGVDATGWGTPFLLVPEATNIEDKTLQRLIYAEEEDVFLSGASPLGIPFWNLKTSPSEKARLGRIEQNDPGVVCTKGYLKFDQEFTEKPICTASKAYQVLKLKALETSGLAKEKIAALKAEVMKKACICHELGGGVLQRRNITHKIDPAICPGPNIVNFKKIVSLKEMVDHIYGRCSLLVNKERPHMFIKELKLQIDHLLQDIKNTSLGLPARSKKKLLEVKNNLLAGIEHYKGISEELIHENFLEVLEELYSYIDEIPLLEDVV